MRVMALFLTLGVIGLVALVVSVLIDDVIDLFDAGDGWLSGPALASFVAAFGFGGALALSAGASGGVAVAVGVASGIVLGAIVGVITRSLMRMSTDATPNADNIVGAHGVVVTAIGGSGIGEVNVVVAGTPTKMTARADDAIDVGTPVTVTAALSATTVHVTARVDTHTEG
jgi:hypothetical protein